MGIYVEPENGTIARKVLWCLENGEVVDINNFEYKDIPDDKMLVCCVENYTFDAVGVAFDEREFERFSYPDDRPKAWFLMDKEIVKANAPAWKSYMEGK